jgi:hypothetical protein
VVYKAPDGEVQLDVHLKGEAVWLTQQQMAELFGRERTVITKHLRNIFQQREPRQLQARHPVPHLGYQNASQPSRAGF